MVKKFIDYTKQRLQEPGTRLFIIVSLLWFMFVWSQGGK